MNTNISNERILFIKKFDLDISNLDRYTTSLLGRFDNYIDSNASSPKQKKNSFILDSFERKNTLKKNISFGLTQKHSLRVVISPISLNFDQCFDNFINKYKFKECSKLNSNFSKLNLSEYKEKEKTESIKKLKKYKINIINKKLKLNNIRKKYSKLKSEESLINYSKNKFNISTSTDQTNINTSLRRKSFNILSQLTNKLKNMYMKSKSPENEKNNLRLDKLHINKFILNPNNKLYKYALSFLTENKKLIIDKIKNIYKSDFLDFDDFCKLIEKIMYIKNEKKIPFNILSQIFDDFADIKNNKININDFSEKLGGNYTEEKIFNKILANQSSQYKIHKIKIIENNNDLKSKSNGFSYIKSISSDKDKLPLFNNKFKNTKNLNELIKDNNNIIDKNNNHKDFKFYFNKDNKKIIKKNFDILKLLSK